MSFEPKTVAFNYLDKSLHDNAWLSPVVSNLKDPKYAATVCIHTYSMDWIGDCNAVMDERGLIQVIIDYPLSKPTTLTIHRTGPVTVLDFVTAVGAMYRTIYQEEARTSRVVEGTVPGMLNRNRTEGKYGICSHGINDLYLEGAELKADGTWHLLMGS